MTAQQGTQPGAYASWPMALGSLSNLAAITLLPCMCTTEFQGPRLIKASGRSCERCLNAS